MKERREQPNQKTNPPMITSAKIYTKTTTTTTTTKTDRQNPRRNGKSKAIQTKSHEVRGLNFGMIRCLFRYSRYAGYIQLIVEI